MRTPLDVMLLESHAGVAGHAEARLTAAGHRVHRCVGADAEEVFPCRGLVAEADCPVAAKVDVALVVRHGVRPFPSDREQGVSCAIRAGVPLVEDGPDLLDPFAPYLAARVESDLVEACESAAAQRARDLEQLVLDGLGALLAADGLERSAVRCEVQLLDGSIRIDVTVDAPIDERIQQTLAVRVFDAVRDASRVDAAKVDISVLGRPTSSKVAGS